MNRAPFPRTLADYAYGELRSAILEGRLSPGERLDQAKICAEFGISRTPLREVLQRLESEGLLRINSHRGAEVVRLGLQEIEEIYEVRAELEAYAAGKSAANWTAATESELERILVQMESETRGADAAALATTHFDFHLTLYRGCDNQQMLRLIEDLMRKCDWYRRATLAQPENAAMSLERHRDIFEAYAARRPDRVQALVRKNILIARESGTPPAHQPSLLEQAVS